MKKQRRRKKQRKPRVYSLEFKVEAVQRICAGENMVALSRILEVPRSMLYYWLERYRESGVERLRAPGRPTLEPSATLQLTPAEEAAKRIVELEQKVGRQALEVDFLKRAFKRVKETRQPSTNAGESASTERSGQ